MAKLRQNDPGTSWFLDYRDVDGKRYRVNTGLKDKNLAKVWLAKCQELLTLAKLGVIEKVGEIDADVIAGRQKKKEIKPLTLEEFREKYEDRCRHDLEMAESSITLNNLAVRSVIRVIGIKAIVEITDEDVIAWKRQLATEMSKTTIAIYHRQLRAAFNRAIKWGMSEKNPFTLVEISREAKDPSKAKNILYEDVRKLLKAIDDSGETQYASYIRFLMYTGCRRNEILFLRWEDIDLQNGVMKIYAQKTKRSMVIPINKALRRVIENMQMQESGYVFQTQSTRRGAGKKQQPWNKDFVTHRFKKYIHVAGLPEHHSLHSLRHTYATYLRQKGVPLDII